MKYRIFFLAVFLGILATGWYGATQLRAGEEHALVGFGWSSNIGWVSFNSENCDENNNGFSDGTRAGCPAFGEPVPNYGVNLEEGTGERDLSGYAWNTAVGWITFEESRLAGCPVGECRAYVDEENVVRGWARALNGTGLDDWDGWISLSDPDTTRNLYGVTIDEEGAFRHFAYGDEIVGWLSWNCLDRNVCAASEYSVYRRVVTRMLTTGVDIEGAAEIDVTDHAENCSSTSCAYSYPRDTEVTLDVYTDPGFIFVGWVGDNADECGELSTCTIMLDIDKDIRADIRATQCNDDVDNEEPDGDGFIDYEEDDGCLSLDDDSEEPPEICNDGIDNNNNGLVDESDPECGDNPNCPSPDGSIDCPACDDGIDNDDDGTRDYNGYTEAPEEGEPIVYEADRSCGRNPHKDSESIESDIRER